MKRLLFQVLVVLWGITSLYAQVPGPSTSPGKSPPKPELPTGPLLRTAEDFSQWELTFAYAEDKKTKSTTAAVAFSPSDMRPRKAVTTKTGRIIHEEITDVNNRRSDMWFNGTTQYRKTGANLTWFQSDPGVRGGDANYSPLPPTGFRNLDWIIADNYAGTAATSDGRKCLIFSPGGYQKLDLSDSSRNDKMAAVAVIAYIDSDTRLPIMVRTHGETHTYRFEAPPSQMQALPDDLMNQIKMGAEARVRLLQPATRPY